jgi:DNA-binding NtrC family response regulator
MPFIAVNCANIGGDTAVSTLFGHKQGSFTGAVATVNGLIGEADGGILFLDEINTLNLECQQRLLRVLNDGSYQRLGDSQTLYSHFQVIAAANCDLYEEVDKGKFLLDLVSRLTGLAVKLKPLRERFDELPIFVELALAKSGVALSPVELDRLVKKCSEYYWRGNVRELFQVIRAMVILSGGDESKVSADHLPVLPGMLAPGHKNGGGQTFDLARLNKLVAPADLGKLIKAISEDQPLETSLESVEKVIIETALKRHGTSSVAAEALSTPKSTFSARKRKLGIEIDE